MVEINFDECRCVCEKVVEEAVEVSTLKILEVFFIVLIVAVVILAMVYAFNKLKNPPEEEGHTYY